MNHTCHPFVKRQCGDPISKMNRTPASWLRLSLLITWFSWTIEPVPTTIECESPQGGYSKGFQDSASYSRQLASLPSQRTDTNRCQRLLKQIEIDEETQVSGF